VLEILRTDESLQIDEILDLLETQLTSSEVFTALFELEITGRVRSLPGKNYVRRCKYAEGDSPSASSTCRE